MNMITTTKITPSSVFQRSIYVLTTFLTIVMMAAPTIGRRACLPAENRHQQRLGDCCSEMACGLMNRL